MAIRTFRSKIAFAPRVGADVAALAAKTRRQLLEREDVQKLRAVKWYPESDAFVAPDESTYYDQLVGYLTELPDEGFKLFPWVVREFKKGAENKDKRLVGIQSRNVQHVEDIINGAIRWLIWAREHNAPTPDYMRKDFGLNEMENWVYEMDAQNAKEEWVDSEPVYTFHDGWHIDKVGPEDVAKEGNMMGHCVGGYGSEARQGLIYSLRDPKGEPHVTIEFDRDPTSGVQQADILQAQGKQNRSPIAEYQEKLDEWYGHLDEKGVSVENRENREPEMEYIDHNEGDYNFEEPEDVFRYHDYMTDQYDRRYHFGEDEEGDYDANDNTYYYQTPRRLRFPQVNYEDSLTPVVRQFVAEHMRGDSYDGNGYDTDDISQFVQGLWLALRHYDTQNYHGGGPDFWKLGWQKLIDAAQHEAEQQLPKMKKAPANQMSLFDKGQDEGTPQIPSDIVAMINYMKELKNAPDKYHTLASYHDPTSGKPHPLVERNIIFPGEGDYPETEWSSYFNDVGMPGIHMPGTIAKLVRIAHTTDWNFHPAEYDGEVECPICGHELEIQFQGGAVCPRCGEKFEVGRGGIIIPPDESVNEMWQQWPDTLPWSDAEQSYYRNAGTKIASLRQDAHAAYDSLINSGGFSLTRSLAAANGKAYFVAYEQPTETVALDSFTAESILDFRKRVLPLLKESAEHLLGGWLNEGLVYLDVSKAFQNREEAISFGLANNQKAIWDGFNGEEIDLDEYRQQDVREARVRKLGNAVQYSNPILSPELAGDKEDDWTESLQAFSGWDTSNQPWPFLYEPKSGWLTWGNPGGFHDHIRDDLHRQGMREPNGTYEGRWYPHDDSVRIFNPAWGSVPNIPKHHEMIRRNVPEEARVRPQEASGGDEWETWLPDLD